MIARFADFARPTARRNAVLVLLAVALFSPDIGLPGGLPAIRLEQLVAIALLPMLALYIWRTPSARTAGRVDIAFAVMAVTTTTTIALAPLFLEDVNWSIRDPFELARIAEYWVLYRFGRAVLPADDGFRPVALLLCGAIALLAAFSVVQYLHPGSFNEQVTSIWTSGHNLDVVERSGRVVGTLGNANYYGIFSGFFLTFGLALILLRTHRDRLLMWAAPAAASLGVLSVVMSQSRTAVAAILGALTLGLIFVVLQRGTRAAYTRAIGLFFAAIVVSVTFVEAVPPQFGSFHARFAPTEFTEGSALSLRITQWRSVFAGFFEERPEFCEGQRLEAISPGSAHIPAATTGQPESDAETLARDVARKEAVAAISGGVLDYFCDNDRWPADMPLEEALVPAYLAKFPSDPLTGEPYPAYVRSGGFAIGAELENPADPEWPTYTLGTIPSLVLNPSFEDSDSPPGSWRTINGLDAQSQGEESLFGDGSAAVTSPPTGALYQVVAYNFPIDRDFVVAAWVRNASDVEQDVQIYIPARLAGGDTVDPYASESFTIPADGAWYHIWLPLRTPPEERMVQIQVAVRIPNNATDATIDVDGVSLTEGTFPPAFTHLRTVDPATQSTEGLPTLADSPIIGVGPRNDVSLGNVDNEYALFLDRYGVLGALSYLFLFVSAFTVALMAWRKDESIVAALSLTVMVFTVSLAAFNFAAGIFYHFQIMAVYWLLIGMLAAAPRKDATDD